MDPTSILDALHFLRHLVETLQLNQEGAILLVVMLLLIVMLMIIFLPLAMVMVVGIHLWKRK